ncbi:hypothetical protein M0R04_12605 [Candidatus Dojkabacteria bacterium]|jgi:peptidoglycan hydrolase CwlO-like protein|nr:hypothetical protein [Candidatus Dojkabacteria bacterium]
MQDKQYEVLLTEVRNIAKRVQKTEDGIYSIDNDLAKDRKDIDDFKLKLENIEGQLSALSSQIARQSGKTKEAVADAVTESVQPISDQMEAFVQKKVLKPVYDISWFSWYFRKIFSRINSEIKG